MTTTDETVLAVQAVDALPQEWQPLAFDLLFAETALGAEYGYAGVDDAARVRDVLLAKTA